MRRWRKSTPSSVDSMCKGPVAEASLVCLRNCEKADGWKRQGREGSKGLCFALYQDPEQDGKFPRFLSKGMEVTTIEELSIPLAAKKGNKSSASSEQCREG